VCTPQWQNSFSDCDDFVTLASRSGSCLLSRRHLLAGGLRTHCGIHGGPTLVSYAAEIDNGGLATVSRVITSRRSIRRYAPRAVSAGLVNSLIETATSAPSAHNRQPWRFAVLAAEPARVRLATVMGERLRADRLRDGDAPDAIEADVKRSQQRIACAPVVIVACLTMTDMDTYADERRSRAEYLMAVQNLLLLAHAAGLSACWMCAPLFCPDLVAEAAHLQRDWQPQAMVTLGYAADAGKAKARRALRDVLRVDGGGETADASIMHRA
jgi:F420 biosynthesis protein FbiB-like protein